MTCPLVFSRFFRFRSPMARLFLYHSTFVRVRFSAVSQLRPCFLFGIGDVLCCDMSSRVGSGCVTPGPVALRRGASRPACPVLSCPVLSGPVRSGPVRSDWFYIRVCGRFGNGIGFYLVRKRRAEFG